MVLEEKSADEYQRVLAYPRLKSFEDYEQWARGLANHLVRNRVTVESLEVEMLVRAAKQVAAFAKAHPYTGLADVLGYKEGESLLRGVAAALAPFERREKSQ